MTLKLYKKSNKYVYYTYETYSISSNGTRVSGSWSCLLGNLLECGRCTSGYCVDSSVSCGGFYYSRPFAPAARYSAFWRVMIWWIPATAPTVFRITTATIHRWRRGHSSREAACARNPSPTSRRALRAFLERRSSTALLWTAVKCQGCWSPAHGA